MPQQLFSTDIQGNFFLRNPKGNKPTNIYFVVRLHRKLSKFATGVKVYPDQWNQTKQEAYVSHRLMEIDNKNNQIVNERLFCIKTRFSAFLEYICSNPENIVNFQNILKRFIGNDMDSIDITNINIIAFLRRSILNDSTISDGTKTNYNKGVTALKSFFEFREKAGKESISDFKQFTTELFWDMADFLVRHYKQPNGKPYAMRSVNDILKLANIAVKKYSVQGGYLTFAEAELIQYRQLTDKTSNDNEIALRNDEVMKLYRYKPTSQLDEVVRDVFLLECTTGQRISDTTRLDENIQDIAGVNVFTLVTKKTGLKLRINLLFDIARKILVDKYNYEMPYCTKDQINKRIKHIAKEAGISGTETISIHVAGNDKPTEIRKERWECISSHTGRRTFVTLLSLRKWNYEQIGKYTGQTVKTVAGYDKSKPADFAIYERTKPCDIVLFISEVRQRKSFGNKSIFISSQQYIDLNDESAN